jgi:hypothetical protein
MHRHHRHRDPKPQPRLRLSHPFARIALGATIAIAVLSAGAFVFGPLSDLSVRQLAAGPQAKGPDDAPAAIVLAHTGRSWGRDAQQRQAGAASTPTTRLARRDARDP